MGNLHEEQLIFFLSYLAQFLEREMFQTKVVEKIKTDILCSVTFLKKIVPFLKKLCLLWSNVKKYCRAGQPTDDSMVHAYWMLDT